MGGKKSEVYRNRDTIYKVAKEAITSLYKAKASFYRHIKLDRDTRVAIMLYNAIKR